MAFSEKLSRLTSRAKRGNYLIHYRKLGEYLKPLPPPSSYPGDRSFFRKILVERTAAPFSPNGERRRHFSRLSSFDKFLNVTFPP